ncbi:MAG: hypothetical protein ACRD96_10300, partial [Bryobacteraceae bacterium]
PGGGVARYYRADLAQNVPVSTEITGYAVSGFVEFEERTGDARYLDAASRAARFLAGAWDRSGEAFPFELSPQPAAYFFDTGIVIRGLLRLWRRTEDNEWLDLAARAGLALARDFRDGEGRWHPILDLRTKAPAPRDARWSRSPGCYQLKSALAWNDLFLGTGDSRFCGWYEEALRDALRTHETFLPGAPEEERVMDRLHAYCYFLEGLLPRLDRDECAAAAREGIERVAGHLRQIGTRFARSDVYAQLARMRLLTGQDADEDARRLAAFQARSDDPRVDGGFHFARRGDGLVPHINPVSTVFAVQALEMQSDAQAGWQSLI